ncbi:hypothetical protein EW146_g3654 [Bondarzewia mesenterica]|uniref:Uncharacterized protein n=1 Tax=Bondarzewia mesenterica TaxID=1095465 RepID=A0A4S4LYT0_9AGAM|nr:hypothetical protein EW146_g3654 [Bondarzewia mesenterica]
MSLPRSNYDPRRVCLNPFPNFSLRLGKNRHIIGVYIAGGLFSLAIWTFLDAAILSAHARAPPNEPDRPPPVHVTFTDWMPGICSLLGMLIINLIDKDRLNGEEGFGDPRAVWRARVVLFVGFALMAGGLAGSVVRPLLSLVLFRFALVIVQKRTIHSFLLGFELQTVLVLKYVLHDYADQFLYYGYANVSQNVAFMLSAIVLWFAQSGPNEYEYSLSI